MMNISEELNQTFDPLDDTKTWPEDQFPLMPVGKMVLDRNPDNFFTQVEQAAFCPANLVPGIELSADKMLQGRVFSYADTQRYRLGVNFKDLPTNRSLATVANNQRDGAMQTKIFNGSINFAPSSQGGLISATEAGVPYEPYVQGNITRECSFYSSPILKSSRMPFSLFITKSITALPCRSMIPSSSRSSS